MKKGFTLVELLAVIVILAVILVIAVPQINSVIKQTKKNSLASTAKIIAAKAEEATVENEILESSEALTCANLVKLDENYGSCTVTVTNGVATVSINGTGKFSGFTCTGTKSSMTCTESGGLTPKYVVSSTSPASVGSAIPSGTDVRDTPNEAMADWEDIIMGIYHDIPYYYIRYMLDENEEIVESYAEFIITDALKIEWKNRYCNSDATCEAKYDNLVNGTYSLRGGDPDEVYEENVNTLKTAFNYTAQPSLCQSTTGNTPSFRCGLYGLPNAFVSSTGSASLYNYDDYSVGTYGCYMYTNESSVCQYG